MRPDLRAGIGNRRGVHDARYKDPFSLQDLIP